MSRHFARDLGADEVSLAWDGNRFDHLPGIDLRCVVVCFHERLGSARVNGMVLRRSEALG